MIVGSGAVVVADASMSTPSVLERATVVGSPTTGDQTTPPAPSEGVQAPVPTTSAAPQASTAAPATSVPPPAPRSPISEAQHTSLPADRPRTAAPAFSVPADGDLPEDADVVVHTKGVVLGRTRRPFTQLTLTVVGADGEVVRAEQVVSGADARYQADVSVHDGRTRRIHAGSRLRVAGDGPIREVPVQLAGLLDERTGELTGVAPPGSVVVAALHPHGSRPGALETLSATAGDDGTFIIDFDRAEPRSEVRFRGHQADVWVRVADGSYLYRVVQTPNLTLERSRRHAGGGYLLPGDQVTFALHRAGGVAATTRAQADDDGVAQARFPEETIGAVREGDVLVMRYHDASGGERSLRLLPMRLDYTISERGVVSGRTIPDRWVVAVVVRGDGLDLPRRSRGRSDAGGAFRIDLGVVAPGDLLMIWTIADVDGVGIGVVRNHQKIR